MTELLIAIAIAAILLAIAVPSFDSASLSSKLTGYANNVVASTMLARNEAIKRNIKVTLCSSTDGATCTGSGWEQGWIMKCSTTDNTVCDATGTATLVLQKYPAVASGYLIREQAGITTIDFQPSGLSATAASMIVCRSSPLGNQERALSLNVGGRMVVSRTNYGTCPPW